MKWRVSNYNDSFCFTTVLDENDDVICDTSYCEGKKTYDAEEEQKNAKLIAAVPEFLEICKRMIYLKDLWLPNYEEALNNEEYRSENMALFQAFNKIKEVLKEIEG